MPYKNKEDHNAYHRKWRKNNREKVRAYGRQSTAKRRQTIKDTVNDFKNVPCADCDNKFPPYVMDFDHVDGDKEYNISDMVAKGYSVDSIIIEIVKCEVVCANCHRERTHKRSGGLD